MKNKSAAKQTFLVSDNQDLSTIELITKIANAMGKKPNLFKVPITLLKLLGFISGKSKDIDRLINSLVIDINETCKILNWKPPYKIDDELKKMTNVFMKSHKNDQNFLFSILYLWNNIIFPPDIIFFICWFFFYKLSYIYPDSCW